MEGCAWPHRERVQWPLVQPHWPNDNAKAGCCGQRDLSEKVPFQRGYTHTHAITVAAAVGRLQSIDIRKLITNALISRCTFDFGQAVAQASKQQLVLAAECQKPHIAVT